MKKILLLIAVALITLPGSAQESNDIRDRFLFGLKAGINYSSVYDSHGEDFETDGKAGFAGGAFLSIPLGTYLGVQPEILFSQKGFQATGTILNGHYSFTRTTNYIDVPLLFALKPTNFLTILAGPQYSYLLRQKDVFANATTSIEQEQEFENDNIRKNTLGIVGGADINLKYLVLGARVGWDIQHNNGDGSSTTPRYKNVWLQGTIGYRLNY